MGHYLVRLSDRPVASKRPISATDTLPSCDGGNMTLGRSEGESGIVDIVLITTSLQSPLITGLGVCVLCLCFYNQNIRRSTDPRRFSRLRGPLQRGSHFPCHSGSI
jgi:hypothetical protein